jgi:hypothetical protein
VSEKTHLTLLKQGILWEKHGVKKKEKGKNNRTRKRRKKENKNVKTVLKAESLMI